MVMPFIYKCRMCSTFKPLCFAHFYKQKASSTGFQCYCKTCDRRIDRDKKRVLRDLGLVKKPSSELSRKYTAKNRAKNLDTSRIRDAEYQKMRRNNPSYRLMSNMSRRIRSMFSSKRDSGSTRHLGYSLSDLLAHLEAQFKDGMSWDNYGSVWHVDHIKPVCLFKAESVECADFKECWSLSNLQPMLAFDNISKGNKYKELSK